MSLSGSRDQSVTQLLQGARQGDEQAREQLFARMQPYLRQVARRAIGRPGKGHAETSDAVQETLLAATHRFADFRGESSREWQNWLTTIVKNVIREEQRYWLQQRRDVRRERRNGSQAYAPQLADSRSRPSQIAIRREEAATLLTAIQKLAERDREVVLLRNFAGLPFAEVAEQLQCTEANARQVWMRALRKLAVEIEQS